MPLTDINNAMRCDQGKAGAGILLSSAAFRQCQEAAAVLHLKGQHLEVIFFFPLCQRLKNFARLGLFPESVNLLHWCLYIYYEGDGNSYKYICIYI